MKTISFLCIATILVIASGNTCNPDSCAIKCCTRYDTCGSFVQECNQFGTCDDDADCLSSKLECHLGKCKPRDRVISQLKDTDENDEFFSDLPGLLEPGPVVPSSTSKNISQPQAKSENSNLKYRDIANITGPGPIMNPPLNVSHNTTAINNESQTNAANFEPNVIENITEPGPIMNPDSNFDKDKVQINTTDSESNAIKNLTEPGPVMNPPNLTPNHSVTNSGRTSKPYDIHNQSNVSSNHSKHLPFWTLRSQKYSSKRSPSRYPRNNTATNQPNQNSTMFANHTSFTNASTQNNTRWHFDPVRHTFVLKFRDNQTNKTKTLVTNSLTSETHNSSHDSDDYQDNINHSFANSTRHSEFHSHNQHVHKHHDHHYHGKNKYHPEDKWWTSNSHNHSSRHHHDHRHHSMGTACLFFWVIFTVVVFASAIGCGICICCSSQSRNAQRSPLDSGRAQNNSASSLASAQECEFVEIKVPDNQTLRIPRRILETHAQQVQNRDARSQDVPSYTPKYHQPRYQYQAPAQFQAQNGMNHAYSLPQSHPQYAHYTESHQTMQPPAQLHPQPTYMLPPQQNTVYFTPSLSRPTYTAQRIDLEPRRAQYVEMRKL